MAISIDDTETITGSIGTGTLTPTFTGANTGCIVAASNLDGTTPTGVTCNGNAMTLATSASSGAAYRAFMYYYVGSLSGTKNVVVSSSGTNWIIVALAVSGIHPTPVAESESGVVAGDTTLTFSVADTTGIIIAAWATYTAVSTPPANYILVANRSVYNYVYKRTSGVSATEAIVFDGTAAQPNAAVATSFIPTPPLARSQVFWFFMKKAKQLWDMDKGIYRPRNTGLVTI